jgi:hypothetical protein
MSDNLDIRRPLPDGYAERVRAIQANERPDPLMLSDDGRTLIVSRVECDLAEALNRIAAEKDCTQSELIRAVLWDWYAKECGIQL